MVIRVLDDERANICDNLLTKLIQDERQYDKSIDKGFVVKDYFKNVIKNEENILLCYEENNIIKGYIYLKQIINNNKKGYLIDGLYVEELYRNKSIASKLIEKALNITKDNGIEVLEINVMSQNKKAIKLYKKYGFNEFKVCFRKKD